MLNRGVDFISLITSAAAEKRPDHFKENQKDLLDTTNKTKEVDEVNVFEAGVPFLSLQSSIELSDCPFLGIFLDLQIRDSVS